MERERVIFLLGCSVCVCVCMCPCIVCRCMNTCMHAEWSIIHTPLQGRCEHMGPWFPGEQQPPSHQAVPSHSPAGKHCWEPLSPALRFYPLSEPSGPHRLWRALGAGCPGVCVCMCVCVCVCVCERERERERERPVDK